MADVAGLTTIKRFNYRGNPTEEFSNTYHFTGAVPADAAAWRALFDALVLQEKTCMVDMVEIIGGYGYATDNPDDHSVWSVDLTAAPNVVVGCTIARGSQTPAPGDAAAWVRWKTSRLTTPGGKAIYLRKYFHGVLINAPTQPDTLYTTQRTALLAFGTKMMDGSFVAGRKLRSQASDETLQGSSASQFITTRTLKRRGKRPH